MRVINRIVMTLAGLFLIVAGLLKANQIYTTPVPSEGFWESWLFLVIQVPLEIGLGVWLVSGLFRKAAWVLGMVCYFGFILVTGYKFATGAESCGCFGNIHVDPLVTLLAVDIPLFLLMAIFRPKGEKLLPPPWPHALHVLIVSVPVCLFIGGLAAALYVHGEVPMGDVGAWVNKPKPKTQQNDNDIVKEVDPDKTPDKAPDKEPDKEPDKTPDKAPGKEPDKTDTATSVPDKTANGNDTSEQPVKDPDEIEGKIEDPPDEGPDAVEDAPIQWPWLESADIADQINTGMVIVMCFRHDCPTCHEDIPAYLKMAKELGVGFDEDSFKMAFLAIPPYGDGHEHDIPEDTKCLRGKLADDREDYNNFASPIVVTLIDGDVYGAWQEKAPDMATIMASFE